MRPRGERSRALFVALSVVLATALVLGAVVLAKSLRGSDHGDVINGTAGPDRLFGRGGDDVIRGHGGRDRLRGGSGNDRLVGGPGRDRMVGGPGRDGFNMRDGVELSAPGNDVIRARDHGLDEINCGAGIDRAVVDRTEDGVFGCERVIVPRKGR